VGPSKSSSCHRSLPTGWNLAVGSANELGYSISDALLDPMSAYRVAFTPDYLQGRRSSGQLY
jgi:hypothetical protein